MRKETVLDHEDAAAIVEALKKELAARGKAAVIAVADAHGELIALLRMDGAAYSSVGVATNKAFTAARLKRPTRELGATLRAKGTDIAFYGDPRYVGFGGGVPLMAAGVVIGGLGVSGLPEDEDVELAEHGAKLLAARGS